MQLLGPMSYRKSIGVSVGLMLSMINHRSINVIIVVSCLTPKLSLAIILVHSDIVGSGRLN